jgi:hypothetical protein
MELDYARFEVLTEVLLKIQVLWGVMLCHWRYSTRYLQDQNTTLLGIYLIKHHLSTLVTRKLLLTEQYGIDG